MKCEFDGLIPWLDFEHPAEVLSQSISLLDLLDRFDIEYYPVNQTQYKVRCWLHSNGEERTPSMFVYTDSNSYYCFGCHEHGTIIDFAAHQLGLSNTPGTLGYNTTIEQLCQWAGITEGTELELKPRIKRPIEETVEHWVLQAGQDLREFLKTKVQMRNYDSWCSWVDRKYERLDQILDSVKDDDYQRAQAYYEHIKKQL